MKIGFLTVGQKKNDSSNQEVILSLILKGKIDISDSEMQMDQTLGSVNGGTRGYRG
jgi:hypothetical protein